MKSIFELADSSKQTFYYYFDRKEPLLPLDRVLIRLKSVKNLKEKTEILKALDSSSSFFDIARSYPDDSTAAEDNYVIAYLREDWQSANRTDIENKLESDAEIEFVSPMYGTSQPSVVVAPTLQLFVVTKDPDFPENYQELLQRYGVADVQLFDRKSNTYLLTLKEKNDYTALEVANDLHESGQFDHSEPNFFQLASLSQFIPDDDLYDDQWNLPNIGMPIAWDRSKGNGMRIAIMDNMVDGHADLNANLVAGYDPTGMPRGFDFHGTRVAGVAAGRGDNGIGIAGVAFEATIVPVRIGWALTADNIAMGTDVAWIIEAFNRCADETQLNADVINCSFGAAPSTLLTNAINNAAANGRDGRGCVICAATGNQFGDPVAYPANLPSVIGVGATNATAHKADFSNDGPGIDLSAPGVDIVTTTPTNAYTTAAPTSGTSFACPAVSGAAALILTVFPNASPDWVRSRLRNTADRTGGYSYVGGWCTELGAGRVNVPAALNEAINVAYPINGPAYLCGSPNPPYTVPNASPTWSAGSGISINATTGQASALISNNGISSWVRASINTGFIIITKDRNIPVGAYHNEFWANGYARSGRYTWASMYMPIFFTYNVNDLTNRIEFGYAPMVGRTTTMPWQTGQPTWIKGGVSGVQIMSQPSGWTNVQNLGDEIRVSNLDPAGLLELKMFTSCGETTVIFDIRREF